MRTISTGRHPARDLLGERRTSPSVGAPNVVPFWAAANDRGQHVGMGVAVDERAHEQT